MEKGDQKLSHIRNQLFMIPSTIFLESRKAERN
jgi:hypothetical protein